MLPKTALGRHMLARMKVYAGPEHPHQAQMASGAAKQGAGASEQQQGEGS